MKNNNFPSRLLPILGFISIITISYIISSMGSSSTYESSIYQVYPIYFWILFIFIFSIMFLNIILYTKEITDYKSVILSIIGSLIALFIFSLLPYFRNYYFYNAWDSLTHLGYVTYIAINNGFGDNFYPSIHILIYMIAEIIGIEPRIVMFFIPIIFTVFFIISIFLLLKLVNIKKEIILFSVAFSILPIFKGQSIYVFPSAEAFFLIPAILFIFIKSRTAKNQISYSIILIIFLLLLPFTHLEVSVIVMLMLIVITLTLYIYSKFSKDKIQLLIQNNTTPILFLSIGIIAWFSSAIIFGGTVQQIYNSIIFNVETSASDIIQTSSLNIMDKLYNIIIIYGVELTYIILASLMLILLFLKRKMNAFYIVLTSLYILMIGVNLISFFKGAIVGLRMSKYIVLISIPLISLLTYKLTTKNFKFNKTLILTIILIPLITLTVFTAYPSPIVKSINLQVTEKSFTGMEFSVKNLNSSAAVLSFPNSPNRFKDAIVGRSERYSEKLYVTYPVDHFGYSKNLENYPNNFGTTGLKSIDKLKLLNGNLGNFYSEDHYFIVDLVTKNFETNGKYSKKDFNQIEMDNTINKIYENGDLNLFIVKGSFYDKM